MELNEPAITAAAVTTLVLTMNATSVAFFEMGFRAPSPVSNKQNLRDDNIFLMFIIYLQDRVACLVLEFIQPASLPVSIRGLTFNRVLISDCTNL